MKDRTRVWLKRIGWTVVIFVFLNLIPTFEAKIKAWSQESELREKRLEEQAEKIRIQLEPPSEKDPRIVTLKEAVWTEFKAPTEGPRKSFRCKRVDPDLWYEYMIDDDPKSIIIIPPQKNKGYRPMIVGSDSYGKDAKYDKVRVHPHPDNPSNRDVRIFYVE